MQWEQWLTNQKSYFQSGNTLGYDFRYQQLEKLYRVIEKNEALIIKALHDDMGKSPFESYLTEISFALDEIKYALKNLKKWMQPKKFLTPLMFQPGQAQILYQPYGQILVMAPWNYPFMLLISPTIGALAAGNVVTLKPSEYAPQTSTLIARLVQENFAPEVLCVVEGNIDISRKLLDREFDYIFYCGSNQVGRIVMEKAAKFLTPVTLELGGKCPAIIDQNIDLEVTARRIAWGKFMNAGQTCVAPDYLLVHRRISKAFIPALAKQIQLFYGLGEKRCRDYARIIDQRHFERLKKLMASGGRIIFGGQLDPQDLFISPTLIDQVDLNSPLMKEEIFGPLLPILEFETEQQAEEIIQTNPNPLALYVFSRDAKFANRFLHHLPFGGGCHNDTIAHLGLMNLPFGGVKSSGLGRYRGRKSFETFSYEKSLYLRPFWGDVSLRYPPYRDKLTKLRELRKRLGHTR